MTGLNEADVDDLEIIKIFGGPGTGKTTTLVGNTNVEEFSGILEKMFQERRAEDLMLIAYTRSAADEALDRLYELTDKNKKTLDKRITTIHSLTMGMTGIRPNNIVEIRNVPDKYNFCGMVDIPYESRSDDDDIMDVPDDAGHQLFQMLSWLQSNRLPVSEWEQCPISSAWNNEMYDIERLAGQWVAYKADKGIYEFDDVIEIAVDNKHTVDATELFVDEVQDLYPLQQAFLDNQADIVDRVWLAGDDDQTIYEWAGANPDYFIDMECQVNGVDDSMWDDKSGYWDSEGVYILDQSYRMPKEIMELSQACIQQVDDRQEKEFKPHKEGGSVSYLNMPTVRQLEEIINYEDTFILCRAKFQCNEVGQMLIEAGIPFKDRFRTWRKSVIQIRDALAAMWNEDETVDGSSAHQLLSTLGGSHKSTDAKWGDAGADFDSRRRVDTSELARCIKIGAPTRSAELNEVVDSMGDDLNYYQREAIKKNIKRGKEDMVPGGVTVETIHWSKGREADTVILSLNTTAAVMQNVGPEGDMPDAERRLYYVGMTRAENNLVLAENLDPQSSSFRPEDLFGEYWEENYE